jgi:glycosyltransferase involved in cell wall biosynthesis
MPRGCGLKLFAVSHYSAWKGYAALFRACGRLARKNVRVRLRVAGIVRHHPLFAGSSAAAALEALPEGIVTFVGSLGREELDAAFREADVFVFPSWLESFGHPMAEALGEGLPVVAADTPVNREVCADAAMYHRPFNSADLARKIRTLAADERLRSELGQRARAAAARFSWRRHAEGLLDVWRRGNGRAK